ncbi:peptidase S10 [uncultured Legionella sp.]|uniref:S10 family serine carboxypeptidase-like protein n=1 Tax=uncultured Legionella sp. TaxID=210934 RepID=UPI00262897A9|nr:peptidase S10 [uncultured Legionella sp.]
MYGRIATQFMYLTLAAFLYLIISSGYATQNNCVKQAYLPFKTIQKNQISYLPGHGCVTNLQLAGHLPVNNQPCNDIYCSEHKASLFYWFVGSQQSTQHKVPIILWLNGGPGASSFYGFFSENGPYVINQMGKLKKRKFAWNEIGHFLMIDNPKGVGLSYASKEDQIKNAQTATIELYNALNAFYQRYPELKDNALYLSGESYAGKYIAELAEQISNHNQKLPAAAQINLQGVIIGDGWVNPLVQQSSVADYAYSHGLIDKNTREKVREIYKKCAQAINNKSPQANSICMKVNDMVAAASGVDRHDIRTLREMDYNPIIEYLNKPEVRKAIHVDPRVTLFKLFNNEVSTNLEQEIQKSASPIYERLLDKKIPILIFNGLDDGTDSNFMGADLWLEQLNWHGKELFNKARTCRWYVGGTNNLAGYVRNADVLTQIKIRGAGHMAPMDQPQNTLDLMKRFINKQEWCHGYAD